MNRITDYHELVNLTIESQMFCDGDRIMGSNSLTDIFGAFARMLGVRNIPEGKLEIRLSERRKSFMYVGIGQETGKRVPEEEAYEYAKKHLDQLSLSDQKEFVEFFFSGNWQKEEKNEAV